MKIVFFLYSLGGGGAEKAAITLFNELSLHHDIQIIAMKKKVDYEVNETMKIEYIDDDDYTASTLIKILRFPLVLWRLSRRVKELQPDILLSFLMRPNLLAVLSTYCGVKSRIILTEHGVLSRYYRFNSISQKMLRLMIRWTYKCADTIIAVSRVGGEDLSKNFGVPCEKIVTIANPFDFAIIREKSFATCPYKKEKFTFVSVGRLVESKGMDDLLRAFMPLSNEAQLIIIGEGEERDKLEELTRQLGITQSVYFVGFDVNPHRWMVLADVFVFASRLESLPTVLIEAMALGLPVISTDCISGPREILAPQSNPWDILKKGMQECEYGILTAVGDNHTLTTAMRELKDNEKMRYNLTQQGLTRCEDFIGEKSVKKYEDVFKRVSAS